MNGRQRGYLIVGFIVGVLAGPCPSHAQYTADYQINVISGVTSNWVDDSSNPGAGYVIGSNWVHDVLLVDAGGVLSNGNGYVGYEVGANDNTVLVSDPGSAWTNNGTLYVGYSGAGNELIIANGGLVQDRYPAAWDEVGLNSSSSNNTVLVSGSGSVWSNRGGLVIGRYGAGNQLLVTDGGHVLDGGNVTFLGSFQSSSNNTVLVSGSGSTWINGGITIGLYGSGNQLQVTDRGQVAGSNPYVGDVYLGYHAGSSNNTLLISGSGSAVRMRSLQIGAGGSDNTLIISNGGAAYATYGYVGSDVSEPPGSNNVAVITGTGSVWSNSSSTCVGCGGGGNQMIITDGGVVYDQSGTVDWISSNNTVVVSGPGSAWKNTGSTAVGLGGAGNQLIITNGGAVYVGGSSTIGYSAGGYACTSNSVIVTGNGSVFGTVNDLYIDAYSPGSNNQLIVSSGALVYDTNGHLSSHGSGANLALVTGPGSVWSNSGSLFIGTNSMASSPDRLIVTNGGAVYDTSALVAGYGSQIFVGGNGATWWNQGNLYLGSTIRSTISNLITIGVGGSVIASNIYVYAAGDRQTQNGITVSGGTLFVTNNLHNGVLDLNAAPLLGNPGNFGGLLTLNGGTVTVDCLVMTNSSQNRYTFGGVKFNSGLLDVKSTIISNDYSPYVLVFTVGNGTNNATLHLATGGTGFHLFAAGLTISSNAALTGIGTIIGQTIVKPGGTLAPGDGPGSMIFSNNLTLAAGSTLALSLKGTGAGQYSQIAGLGGISVSNAVLNISLGYAPLPGDSFTIISNLTSSAILGTFVTTDGLALPNGTDFTVDNTVFQIDYAANADGLDVTLTAQVPEPSSLLLTALGAITLWIFVKRKRA